MFKISLPLFLIGTGTIIALATVPALGEETITMEQMKKAQHVSRVQAQIDTNLKKVDHSNRTFLRHENGLFNQVSYFHQRKIGRAIVENDFIRYRFNTRTGEEISSTRNWRQGLPNQLPRIIDQSLAESMVDGKILSVRLMYISPHSEIFKIKPVPENPCWIIRSETNQARKVTVIDAVTGNKLGLGIPAPYEGFSMHGPDWEDCDNNSPLWYDHAENARSWFEQMGYSTIRDGSAYQSVVQSHIQSDETVMFYELDHGDGYSYHNRCEENITANEVDTWIENYAPMGFTFIGSCGGLTWTGDGTFEHEFRKEGLSEDTVVVGYDGMSDAVCADDCWGYAIAWQTKLFSDMNDGYTVSYAFAQANMDYPDCTDDNHNCMVFMGDGNLRFAGTGLPKVTRSISGAIANQSVSGDDTSPLPGVPDRFHHRPYFVRSNLDVPSTEHLTLYTTSTDKYIDLAFLNGSKLTVNGYYLFADGSNGGVKFVSGLDSHKGMEITGELKMYTGGEIRVFE